jgi:hypothetical protein
MPANLNALIRYKQIDRCLKNPFVDCTIQKMQELCSEALGEFRGIYKQVSERTIRDDIRVMRSEMLGFNAPIELKDGVYYYTDKDYSIFDIPVRDAGLLEEVYEMLKNEHNNLPENQVTTILNKIALLINKEPQEEHYTSYSISHNSKWPERESKITPPEPTESKSIKINKQRDLIINKSIQLKEMLPKTDLHEKTEQPAKDDSAFTWGQIMEVLSTN